MAACQIRIVLQTKDREEDPLFLADIAVGKSPQFSPSSFHSSLVFQSSSSPFSLSEANVIHRVSMDPLPDQRLLHERCRGAFLPRMLSAGISPSIGVHRCRLDFPLRRRNSKASRAEHSGDPAAG
jgi:hypothetical protein